MGSWQVNMKEVGESRITCISDLYNEERFKNCLSLEDLCQKTILPEHLHIGIDVGCTQEKLENKYISYENILNNI